jgi:hypothetical protein
MDSDSALPQVFLASKTKTDIKAKSCNETLHTEGVIQPAINRSPRRARRIACSNDALVFRERKVTPSRLQDGLTRYSRLSAISTRAISTRSIASARSSASSRARRRASSSLCRASALSISESDSASSASTMT